jgi:hypothetical protein
MLGQFSLFAWLSLSLRPPPTHTQSHAAYPMTAPAGRGGAGRHLARAAWRAATAAAQGRACRHQAFASAPSASAPAPPPPPPPRSLTLLRDFIAASLSTYFSRPGPACPVGSGARLPPISSLAGRTAYEAAVASLYASNPPGAWLTPAELFSPHFGAALAAFILRHHAAHAPPDSPLHIVEVGAGRGTLARDVLDAVAAADEGLYSRTRYATLDVSPALAEQAAAAVRGAGHCGDRVFTQTLGDACEAGAWAAVARALSSDSGGSSHHPPSPYLLLCEALDNLPHDKAVRVAPGEGGGGLSSTWAQAMVAWGGLEGDGPPPVEVLTPLADPVVATCLAAALEEEEEEEEGGGGRARPASLLARLADFALGNGGDRTPASAASCLFLPTGAARLLESAAAAFPAHTLVAFDFDALPTTGRPACWGAPIVSGPPSPGQAAIDYPDPLAPPFGTADIFFPTHFGLLARLARRVGGPDASDALATTTTTTVTKAAAFLRAHVPPGALAATTTASGWNPMLDDFANTSALVVERSRRKLV